MEYRQLGESGLQVSAMGLGCNPMGLEVDEAGAAAIIHRAIDLGVTFVDTANIYHHGRSEELVGKALRGHRHQVVLATKAGGAFDPEPNQGGTSRKHLLESIDASLRRLQTDYVDLFQIHHQDPKTPYDETMDALNDIVRQGKARYIGASNYLAWQVCESIWHAKTAHQASFSSVQMHYNLLYRDVELELLPLCQAYGLGFIPYFPMAGGFLTDTYRRGQPAPPGTRGAGRPTFARWTSDRNWDVKERLQAWASERGHTVSELAVAWLLTRPTLSTVIAGPESVDQLEANVRAIEWRLTPDELKEIDQIAPSAAAPVTGATPG